MIRFVEWVAVASLCGMAVGITTAMVFAVMGNSPFIGFEIVVGAGVCFLWAMLVLTIDLVRKGS